MLTLNVGAIHTELLRGFDKALQIAAKGHEIPACDGLDDSEPCDIGDLHTKAAILAQRIAHELCDIHDGRDALAAFADLLATARGRFRAVREAAVASGFSSTETR